MFRQVCAPVTIRAADRPLGSPALQVDSPWIGFRLRRLELSLLSEAVRLLAEDEALIGMTLQSILEDGGFRVLHVLSGEEGLTELRDNPTSILGAPTVLRCCFAP